MSTVLRGYTSIENDLPLKSSELQLELKAAKGKRTDFLIDITDKDFEDFNGQVTDTIAFLTTNRVQLVELKDAIPDIIWEIDYGYNTKVATGELAVEGLHLPLELLRLCSELKIEILISLYDGKLFG
ncbi:MAG TPA: hypothetical protein VMR70_12820 [Flavisolibacter sp.]|nr:hypothetical protein [Flavisolibacter sp.]